MSNLRGDGERQRSPERTSNREAEVQPRGPGETADSLVARRRTESPMFGEQLMEEICQRSNLKAALKRVRANGGSPGVDGMTVEQLPGHLQANWLSIKEQLLTGKYQPRPIKGVEIPKPGSKGKRNLGIPCVIDRLIEQAMLQVLQRKWDRRFSESSYGFRPGRSAHQARARAQEYVQSGYGYVVDLDLEKFFDRVNHDRLMSRLAQEIGDKRVWKLIRAYLNAGILQNGLVSVPKEGTPQGSPLSPFLSNVVLDELDQELEHRGHRFVRYAADCNIYVRTQRAGERVMASVSRFVSRRLKLRVNREKSAVDVPQKRKFLGFTFTGGRLPNRRKIAPESIQRFRIRVRRLTRRSGGISLEERVQQLSRYLRGWKGYYGYCEASWVLCELDRWIRRRLRCVQGKQWKGPRRRRAELIRLGVRPDLAQATAWSSKGPWLLSHTAGVQMALTNEYFDRLGLPRLEAHRYIQP